MKSILDLAGKSLVVVGVILFLVLTFVVKSDGVSGVQDLLGLTIPQPPAFTTFIPYLGYVIGIVFEMFSLHGVIALGLPLLLVGTGMHLVKGVSDVLSANQNEGIKQKYTTKSALELQKELEEKLYGDNLK